MSLQEYFPISCSSSSSSFSLASLVWELSGSAKYTGGFETNSVSVCGSQMHDVALHRRAVRHRTAARWSYAPSGRSDRLVVRAVEHRVCRRAAPADAQVFHAVQREGAVGCTRRGDGKEVGAIDVGKVEGRPRVRRRVGNLHVAHLEIADVAQEETRHGRRPKPSGIG